MEGTEQAGGRVKRRSQKVRAKKTVGKIPADGMPNERSGSIMLRLSVNVNAVLTFRRIIIIRFFRAEEGAGLAALVIA